MKNGTAYLASLADPADPSRVIWEVLRLMRDTLGGEGLSPLDGEGLSTLARIHADVARLFAGEWPGYAPCDTRYHDLEHTADTFLAMARMIHGAFRVPGPVLDRRTALLGLVGALLHDTGYIRRLDDRTGSGARYTKTHIARSIEFSREYLRAGGFAEEDVDLVRKILLCTGLDTCIEAVDFRSEAEGVIGRMLGTADLLGQMASLRYPAKLPHLFREFVEAGIPAGSSEASFIERTPEFYAAVRARLDGDLGSVHRYLRHHFRVYLNVNRDLYREAVEENIAYLHSALREHPADYRAWLDRAADRLPGAGGPFLARHG